MSITHRILEPLPQIMIHVAEESGDCEIPQVDSCIQILESVFKCLLMFYDLNVLNAILQMKRLSPRKVKWLLQVKDKTGFRIQHWMCFCLRVISLLCLIQNLCWSLNLAFVTCSINTYSMDDRILNTETQTLKLVF